MNNPSPTKKDNKGGESSSSEALKKFNSPISGGINQSSKSPGGVKPIILGSDRKDTESIQEEEVPEEEDYNEDDFE